MVDLLLLFALFVIILGCVICSFIGYDLEKWWQRKKIKFDTFLKFYNVAPYKWRLDTNTVEYKLNVRSWPYEKFETFRFGIIDTMQYVLWHRKAEKIKRKKKQCEEMNEFLEQVKKDIEEFQAENEQKVAKDLKEIWRKE